MTPRREQLQSRNHISAKIPTRPEAGSGIAATECGTIVGTQPLSMMMYCTEDALGVVNLDH